MVVPILTLTPRVMVIQAVLPPADVTTLTIVLGMQNQVQDGVQVRLGEDQATQGALVLVPDMMLTLKAIHHPVKSTR